MIRWSYLLPRLLVVATLVLGYWLGLNPLVRWALIRAGQSITAAKVDIDTAHASLARGAVKLSGLQVADPQNPMKNLLAADQIALDLEPSALLRGKLIVEEARATGLRLDSDRQTSGALRTDDGRPFSLPGKDLLRAGGRELAELGRQWLEHVTAGLREDLAREVERLESVRMAGQLAQRWPRECQDLEARIEGLRSRIDRVRDGFARPPANPMETFQHYRQLTADLEAIQRDVEQFQRQCEQLPQQALRDREAIVAAARRDLDDLGRRFRVSQPVPEQLAEYLLQRELGEKVTAAARWIRWATRHVTAAPAGPEPVRGRGLDILPARPSEPDFLVRWLSVEGRAWCDGRPWDFVATVSDLTNQPQIVRQATIVRAQVKLPFEMWIEATLDRTGAEACDRIVVHCPGLAQPSRTLGDPEQFALAISPGKTALALEVELRGPRLSGKLRVVQQPVELTPVVGAGCGGERVAAALRAGLAPLRRLEAEAQLSGTADLPEWRLQSNLGPQLAAALSQAFQGELESRRKELQAQLQLRLDGELARVERMLAGQQEQLLAKLQGQIVEARQLGQSLAQRLPIAPPALPGNLPFRF